MIAAAIAALAARCAPLAPVDNQATWGPGRPAAASAASAPLAGCATLFPGGAAPRLLNAKLATRTTPICYKAYGVLFSGVTRTPLWSAERLTSAAVDAARGIDRVDEFHPDDHLSPDDRSELRDFRRSGFDRGHMTPSGDEPTPDAQAESFSLANIVPQAPALNRGKWSAIESAVRAMAERSGVVYVVTGPLFEGEQLATIGGRVVVPTSVFKAVYVPGEGAAAYIATNADPAAVRQVTIAELDASAGIDVFPALSDADKARALALPVPDAARRRRAATADGAPA